MDIVTSDHCPKRLRRLTQVWIQRGRPIFFITICTLNRKAILATDLVHQAFISFCKCSPERAHVWIGRYVIMPDHLHVFVSAEGSIALGKWVGSLKGVIAAALRKHDQIRNLWQDGFFDHLMRSNESYSEKWEYVLNNPVRAGLVDDPNKWPYKGEIHQLIW